MRAPKKPARQSLRDPVTTLEGNTMLAQRPFLAGVVLVSSVLVSTATVWAQSTGNIAGLVTDESGAVVPGVTVEASSPALIEGVRTAVSDDAGHFKIEALQPGTYNVTF